MIASGTVSQAAAQREAGRAPDQRTASFEEQDQPRRKTDRDDRGAKRCRKRDEFQAMPGATTRAPAQQHAVRIPVQAQVAAK